METYRMGLDTVELVMEIEDSFSIEIPDDEVSRMVTVGDLHEYILANTKWASNPTVCLSAVAFRSLCQAARSIGVNDRLRPRDSTLRLLPYSNRRGFWAELQKTSKLKLPKLCRPQWIVFVATFAILLLSAWVGSLTFSWTQSQLGSIASALAVAMLTGWILSVLTAPLAVLPRNSFATLRGLVEAVVGLNFKSLANLHDGAHSNDVWLALRAIIVEQLGVSPEAVKPTASFVKDLGCD